MRTSLTLGITALAILCLQLRTQAATLHLEIVDEAGQLLPARIHLADPDGKPVRPPGLPFFRDHFVCTGKVELALSPGAYRAEIEHGKEHWIELRTWTLQEQTPIRDRVRLRRFANLASEGWWSGDLHIHRPPEDAPLLAEAEDLHIAPIITWWNNQNRWSSTPLPQPSVRHLPGPRVLDLLGGEDEREGGALLYFGMSKPIPIQSATREYPSPMEFLSQARAQDPSAWVDVEKPFWWDAPVWVASGKVDSLGIANNHMNRDGVYPGEAWGRPRDPNQFPGPHGNGLWTQQIYYHFLNAGIRIPPSAGSASGVLPNPVGYNRVYVHLQGAFDPRQWWEGLRAGRSFVSNGPLLRAQANRQWPGRVFRFKPSDPRTLRLTGTLHTRDAIREIELIHNGRTVRRVPFDPRHPDFDLGSLDFQESGWCLVRAIAEHPKTFRFAATAPWHVEIEGRPNRISRESAKFFLDWVRERIARIRLDDPSQKEAVLHHQHAAEEFWTAKLRDANTD